MKKKILVLGRTGMLGYMVMSVLSNSDGLLVSGTQRDNPKEEFYFDVKKGIGTLKEAYDRNQGFDYFVNCIGITRPKINVKNPGSIINAVEVNTFFPHRLAAFAERNNVKVIHISTDGVFSGRHEYYAESSSRDCTDIYGRTKSLGEAKGNNLINIRCSILGPSPFEKEGLLEWFLSQKEGSTIDGYTNNIWNGVTTLQFAELCENIIRRDEFNRLRKLSSVFHFAPNRPISKYELFLLLKSAFTKDVNISPAEDNRGSIRRVLKSDYEAIKMVYPQGLPMEKVIKQLVDFVNTHGIKRLERRN